MPPHFQVGAVDVGLGGVGPGGYGGVQVRLGALKIALLHTGRAAALQPIRDLRVQPQRRVIVGDGGVQSPPLPMCPGPVDVGVGEGRPDGEGGGVVAGGGVPLTLALVGQAPGDQGVGVARIDPHRGVVVDQRFVVSTGDGVDVAAVDVGQDVVGIEGDGGGEVGDGFGPAALGAVGEAGIA